MNKIKTLKERAFAMIRRNAARVATGVVLVGSAAAAHASGGGSDPTAIVSSASSLLTSIYPVVIGAVSFGILVSLVKMVRRK